MEQFALYQELDQAPLKKNKSKVYWISRRKAVEVLVFAMTVKGLTKAMQYVKNERAKIIPLPGKFTDPEELLAFCRRSIKHGKAKSIPAASKEM